MQAKQPLIQVEDLRKLYPVEAGLFHKTDSWIHAVDRVRFEIERGESLALVGESGRGKTATGKLLVKLVEPTSGSIFLQANGRRIDVAGLRGKELKAYRREVQMVFQDPYESMNPRRTIYDTVAEPLAVQHVGSFAEMLSLVRLTPPASFLFRFPHELSGGQRQRVAIARALIVQPSFVVADEPTSMLDVSIRAGVMRLMGDLARRQPAHRSAAALPVLRALPDRREGVRGERSPAAGRQRRRTRRGMLPGLKVHSVPDGAVTATSAPNRTVRG
ncbi:MAG TPA: dipeptide/oligopeptide/nickel ABC transporter ATP-binding protein [Anaerolineae bacterium]|nr:dipeptide/oligopeptide/nickel ABC transporter ATP-binding protein [Anaerolineae bacterium]